MKRALLGAALISIACCGPKGGANNPRPDLTVEAVVAELAKARSELKSFRGESVMDYWVSGQRMKGDVLVMGQTGKLVRFAALSPAGGSTIVEMACDGTNFVYLNYQDNCVLTGPCDARSVAMFFGIELEPDDFVHLALGTPSTIGGNPTGKITWDGSRKVHKVELTSVEGTQKLSIDTTAWDVHDTELLGTDGKQRWSATNTDFRKVQGSGERRVPGKTRFKSPAQSQDLLVDWGNQFEVNAALPVANFTIQVPAGLGTCGQQAPKQAPPAGAAPAKPKS
jgi:outer membrane lipoprotein-sorting protein